MDIRYPAKLTREETGFLVEFIDLDDTFRGCPEFCVNGIH